MEVSNFFQLQLIATDCVLPMKIRRLQVGNLSIAFFDKFVQVFFDKFVKVLRDYLTVEFSCISLGRLLHLFLLQIEWF